MKILERPHAGMFVCADLFCRWRGGVEEGAGVGYEFGEAMSEGEDAFGLAEADGVFGN